MSADAGLLVKLVTHKFVRIYSERTMGDAFTRDISSTVILFATVLLLLHSRSIFLWLFVIKRCGPALCYFVVKIRVLK